MPTLFPLVLFTILSAYQAVMAVVLFGTPRRKLFVVNIVGLTLSCINLGIHMEKLA